VSKIAVVVGHTNQRDKGAFSPYLLQSEQPYNLQVALQLKSLAPELYDVHTHSVQDYYKRQVAMSQKLNAGGYRLAIELHFNAASSPTANGTYCLYWYGSKVGKHVAACISEDIVKGFNTKLRAVGGAQALVNEHDRGYWFTALTNMPAVIVEPFFGSNIEALRFQDTHRYAYVLHNYLKGWKK
jgi:N-acetylmuramoyl-L-alanine amidase